MNSSGYGPASAPSISGGIPAQRPPTQQTYEAPACVQNAMMTKDKKPFTYTPGGIDLSQIKSERMAKRLARNAQSEGATGASQMNRPVQPPSSPGGTPVAASIGAAAMGVPFQVFPAGPPTPPAPSVAPPSTMGKQQRPNGSIGAATAPPPPPPPPSSTNNTTLAPPTNKANALAAPGSPNAARKSPIPQKFEPPPMGFRPEIKIPPNPMAALKKITPPVEKNNFWVEEYRKERSKSPMAGSNDNNTQYNSNGSYAICNDNVRDEIKNSPATKSMQQPVVEVKNNYNNNNNNCQQTSPPQQQQQPPQPFAPIKQQPQPQSPKPEFRSVTPPQSPTVLLYTQQQEQQQRQPQLNNIGNVQNSSIQQQQPSSPFTQQLQQQQKQATQPTPGYSTSSPPSQITPPTDGQSSSPAQNVPWRVQRGPQQQELQSKQQQPQPQPQPIYNNVKAREVYTPTNSEPTVVQQPRQQPYQGPKPTNVGSLYIAPLDPPNEAKASNAPRQAPTARWMCSQPVQKEQPAWARPEENGNVVPSTLQRVKSPPATSALQQPQQQQYRPPQGNGYTTPTAPTGAQNFGAHPPPSSATGLRLQINAGTNNNNNQSNPKERIIPIQLEQTPTPTHTPGGQPGFGTQVQYGSNNNVNQQTVGAGNIASSSYVLRSPNQFVDQGYNNYITSPQQLQQQQLQQQQQQQQQKAPNNQYNNSNSANAGGSKTHIIPIKIEDQNEGSRGPISQIPIVIQNDQRTPPVQSKSFRILQKITDTIGDQNGVTASGAAPVSAPAESIKAVEPQLQKPQFARQMSAQQARKSPNIEQMKRMQIAQEQQQAWSPGSPVVKQASIQQPNKQRTIYSEDTSKQYIHPSEQQVPEPKKYTGSAIPSRSFKILQAMTTPENAGPGQSDL